MKTKLAEKLELARSLVLPNLVAHLEMEQEAKSLTEAKFHITTREEIEKKLNCPRWVWDAKWRLAHAPNTPAPFIFGGLVLPSIASVPVALCTSHWLIASVCHLVWAGFMAWVDFTSTAEMHYTYLRDFYGNIPYGGLLAVKEAKERGLGNFRVWYPSLHSSHMRDLDPVITGEKNGVLVELFAWDDGKVYE